jgi:hypothetical protein
VSETEDRQERTDRTQHNISTGFIRKREPEEGVFSKKAGAHCHTQA